MPAWWALPPLLLQCIALNWSAPLTWPTWGLVLCVVFKLRECRRPFDRRLLALLQLLSTGLLAAQLQGLLASLLQFVAVSLALAGLLGHELAGALSLRGFLQRSLQLLAAALPLALVLFLFVPRLPPLWTSQLGPTRGAVSGLSPELDPLSIANAGLPAAALAAESEQRPGLNVPWWRWLQWQWWGLDLAWTRWWLSFDQTSQQAWLQLLFGAQLRWLGVTVVVSGCSAVAGGWLLLRVGRRSRSPLAQSLRLLARRGVVPLQGESFPRLCRRAATMQPDLAGLLEAMADHQQLLAHAPLTASQRRQHLRRWRQLRSQLGRRR